MKKLPFTELIETINRFETKRFASKTCLKIQKTLLKNIATKSLNSGKECENLNLHGGLRAPRSVDGGLHSGEM